MSNSNENPGPAFLQELSEDVTLNATLAFETITGREQVKAFVLKIVSQFTSLEPIFKESFGGREFLAYVAKLKDGQRVEGTVILSRNDAGDVSNAIIGHSPFKAVQAMVAEIAANS